MAATVIKRSGVSKLPLEIYMLSTDTKPTEETLEDTIPNGSWLYVMDSTTKTIIEAWTWFGDWYKG